MNGTINRPYQPERVESAVWACVGFVAGMVFVVVTLYAFSGGAA